MGLIRSVGRRLAGATHRVARKKPNRLPASGWVELERLGLSLRLCMDHYIDRTIAERGVFEPDTTSLVEDLVKPGMHVLDVGANIGYHTLLIARAVGPTGMVWAFEPVSSYREQLQWHVEKNGFLSNVKILPFGLSDVSTTSVISMDNVSATMHWTSNTEPDGCEEIALHPLDAIADDLGIHRIDFIKLDIDGHEPRFLRGAAEILRRQHPIMVMEFAQHCLHVAGSDVREVSRQLAELGYVICSEKTRQPYLTEMDFLMDCGNFDRSCNALVIKRTSDPQ